MAFLICSKEEFKQSNIEMFDFILVTGDAYVDHPSFGVAIISRMVESMGFTIGIISQPNWNEIDSFKIYGQPKYAFFVSSGNIDSMVNHYSVSKRRRQRDLYSPNGEMGLRPDRALIVYGNKIREAYKNTPIIIGGIEASLRRLSHYDYWDNKVRRSVLLDSSADLLLYGMGERSIKEVCNALRDGIKVEDINYIKGTVFKTKDRNLIESIDGIELPSFKDVTKDKFKYGESFKIQKENSEFGVAKTLIESYGSVYVVQNIPQRPVTTEEFDEAYNLPYERNYHPMYEKMGGVPAITEVKFSIINNRGCFGACNFCALTFHQGRTVSVRSHESVINEAKKITDMEDFKGYIHDVGGPTANFSGPACEKQEKMGGCTKKDCLSPEPCKSLKINHDNYVSLLRELRELPKIKKVFVRSGIRYDYVMYDKSEEFFNELCEHHISGQLKVAPEHISNKVLSQMGKPSVEVYNLFWDKYKRINEKLGKKQFLVPYLMSSHPGSDLNEAIKLAEYLKKNNINPEQVQDFYPTPSTLSTCIYYTGVNPFTGEEIYTPKTKEEKAMQRALIQFKNPKNYNLVKNALIKAERQDLIGTGKDCLIWDKDARGNFVSPNSNVSREKGKTNSKSKGKYNDNSTKEKPKKRKTIRNVHKKKK